MINTNFVSIDYLVLKVAITDYFIIMTFFALRAIILNFFTQKKY